MLEILTRLPTESVLHCKLVCKSWRDIVRLPLFSQLHLIGKLGFIIRTGTDLFYYAEYDENCHDKPFSREKEMCLYPPLGFKNCSFIGLCNGLMCFTRQINDHRGPFICNPITGEYVILPDSETNHLWSGFGYSCSTNEYKVVRIHESWKKSILQIYTLGSGNGWRTVQNKNMNLTEKVSTGEFANGALHWLDRAGTVIAFNLTYEIFSELPSPPPCLTQAAAPYYYIELKALSGFLSAYCYYKSGCSEFWILKTNMDNSELSWSKEFSFNSTTYSPTIYSPFGFMKSGKLLCCGMKEICCYDSESLSAKMDVIFGKSISQAIAHTNSLVSLKVLEGERIQKQWNFFFSKHKQWNLVKEPVQVIN